MANIKKRIKANCLNCNNEFEFLPNHTRGKYCNLTCQSTDRKNKKLENDKLLFEKGDLTYRGRIKIFVKERDGEKCSSCQREEWLNHKIPLWLDHIDGNASNNNPSNFRLICPNCDSLNATFGGKNRGNGRKSRGLKPWA
jgi:Zn finger protein HypA/HybF involved in hydrogenase expression